jgi:hypothetical protein
MMQRDDNVIFRLKEEYAFFNVLKYLAITNGIILSCGITYFVVYFIINPLSIKSVIIAIFFVFILLLSFAGSIVIVIILNLMSNAYQILGLKNKLIILGWYFQHDKTEVDINDINGIGICQIKDSNYFNNLDYNQGKPCKIFRSTPKGNWLIINTKKCNFYFEQSNAIQSESIIQKTYNLNILDEAEIL